MAMDRKEVIERLRAVAVATRNLGSGKKIRTHAGFAAHFDAMAVQLAADILEGKEPMGYTDKEPVK